MTRPIPTPDLADTDPAAPSGADPALRMRLAAGGALAAMAGVFAASHVWGGEAGVWGYGGVFVSSWDILQDVPNPIRLRGLEVCDESSDLDECFAAGVCEAFVFARNRVWLARGSRND